MIVKQREHWRMSEKKLKKKIYEHLDETGRHIDTCSKAGHNCLNKLNRVT